jgi:hypothetical protein
MARVMNVGRCTYYFRVITLLRRGIFLEVMGEHGCEDLLHTFTTKICTHNKNPVGNGTTM